jgi:aerobic carbon-monoxide dehydrogenase medium subunit
VKPSAFEYLVPDSCEEAVDALAEHGDDAAVLAGGQSLIPMMNLRIAAPPILVDIMRIADLRTIERDGDWIEIGAGIRMAQAEQQSGVPLIGRALRHVGHSAIRNAGTVCGSIAHADPAAELPAVLLALEGEVVLRSVRGRRVVAADDFFRSYFTTAREPDELVVAVRIPLTRRRVAFLEVTPRLGGTTGEFATVAVAATADLDDDGRSFADVSLAFAGVAERAIRAREAEALLAGAEPTAETLDAAARAAARAAEDPPADVHAGPAYRRRLVNALTRRALEELGSR